MRMCICRKSSSTSLPVGRKYVSGGKRHSDSPGTPEAAQRSEESALLCLCGEIRDACREKHTAKWPGSGRRTDRKARPAPRYAPNGYGFK
eukprot:1823471-Prymnesium_polylepis.1